MNDQTEPAFQVARNGAIGLLTLNRPAQINAVNDSIRNGLPAAIASFDRDPDIRVILLSGNGDRGFCAGADVKEQRGAETPLEALRRMGLNPWIEGVATARKPVLAAIHGACMGGGMELALACDMRIASPDARFALPEARLGLIPGGGGTQRLPRVVGLGPALDMLMTGRTIDAQEALRIGLVTRLAESRERLFDVAFEIAQGIAAMPPNAVIAAKRAAHAAATSPLAVGLELEQTAFALLLTSEDRIEAATAFREKRPPQFTGR
ncbi:enoyl-CoA hydratase/isomerase family protein [Novosphingobium sp. BL-52-GroH]|uniref:enoyl-CoA hydratase/isomerase family protein n=1 Tax=Novosphingobium sp. BL-52-GroH TaxID=3349877 RepID=UPI00384E686B